MRSSTLLLVSLISLSFLHCGGDDGGSGGGADADPTPDGDGGTCDPASVLPQGWMPVDAVSAGAVSSEVVGDVVETTVDASAGGFMMSDDEAFVYLAFAEGELAVVDITDVDSFASSDWDIALKRYVIRANGGDSGPGGVRVAQMAVDGIENVDTAPYDPDFNVDRWTDASCFFLSDGIGGPLTRFSQWWEGDAGVLTPNPLVYVVRRSDGDFKIEVDDYTADPDLPEKAAVYLLRWAPL